MKRNVFISVIVLEVPDVPQNYRFIKMKEMLSVNFRCVDDVNEKAASRGTQKLKNANLVAKAIVSK